MKNAVYFIFYFVKLYKLQNNEFKQQKNFSSICFSYI